MNFDIESEVGYMVSRSENLKVLLEVFSQTYIDGVANTLADKLPDVRKMLFAISDLAGYYAQSDREANQKIFSAINASRKVVSL